MKGENVKPGECQRETGMPPTERGAAVGEDDRGDGGSVAGGPAFELDVRRDGAKVRGRRRRTRHNGAVTIQRAAGKRAKDERRRGERKDEVLLLYKMRTYTFTL